MRTASSAAISLAFAPSNAAPGRICRGHGGVELLFGNNVFFHQRRVSLQIQLGLGVVRLRLGDLGLGCFQLPLRLLHRCVGRAHTGGGRLQGGAGVYPDDGYIDPHSFIVGLGALQAGLILLHRHLKIFRIDFGNQGAGLHVLILFDIDPDHLPGNPGADLDQVTIHLCVIGVFVIRGVPPEEQGAHDKNRDHADDDKPAPPLFSGRAIQVLILRIILASLRTLYDGTCTA